MQESEGTPDHIQNDRDQTAISRRKKHRRIAWVALIALSFDSLTWFFYGRHHPPEFCCKGVESFNVELGREREVFVIFSDRECARLLADSNENVFQVADPDAENELFSLKRPDRSIETYFELTGVRKEGAMHTRDQVHSSYPMYNVTEYDFYASGLRGSSGYIHSVWLGWFWFSFYEQQYRMS